MTGEVKKVLKQAGAICFDVDSTVIKEEGIDELARFCNKGDEVANLWVFSLLRVMGNKYECILKMTGHHYWIL